MKSGNQGLGRVNNEKVKSVSSQTNFSQTGFFKNSWATSQIQSDSCEIHS
jgi:hypothetical protein